MNALKDCNEIKTETESLENSKASNIQKVTGKELLTEIYESLASKVISSISFEEKLSDQTYHMISIVQSLYSQINASEGYLSAPYFGNACAGHL